MSDTHSFLPMGGVLHIFHITSTLNCQWEGWWYPRHFTSSESQLFEGRVGSFTFHIQSHRRGIVGWVVSSTFHIQSFTSSGGWGMLHISPTKLNVPQQWNQTDFHLYMPAQLKLLPAQLWKQSICGHRNNPVSLKKSKNNPQFGHHM